MRFNNGIGPIFEIWLSGEKKSSGETSGLNSANIALRPGGKKKKEKNI